MRTVLQDFRYALRMLVKAPGFTIVAVLTLALGIGANTAIFSVVNGLLLHPYGIAHPERLLAIRARYEKLNLKNIVISAPDYTFVRDNTKTFAAAAIENQSDFNYATGSWPLRLRGARVSWQWFDVFEARPLLGRLFTPEEDQPNANREVVLSYNTWRTIFGGDSDILGRSVEFNQQPYKIIGVMGPEFQWPSQTDLWAPLGLAPDAFDISNIFNENYLAIARLQPDANFSNASAFLALTSQRVGDDPRTKGYPKASEWGLFAVPFAEFIYGDVLTPLLILLGAVSLVLLIACSNVAGLLLARASGRAKEFAVRTALGGSPWRLARQMLTESLVLAFAGMALGLVLASQGVRALLWLAPENLSTGLDIHLDLYVLVFTALIAGASAIIFGAAPALQIAFIDPHQNLKQGRGTGEGGSGRHRFRSGLVVAELSLALVLLAGAGVFLKSLAKLKEVDVGFRPQGLMSAALALPDRQYNTPEKQIAFLSSTLERLSNSAGVVSAAAGVPLPFSGFGGSASFDIEGRVAPPGDPGPHGDIRGVSPKYFETMGIRLIRGRFFTDQDRRAGQPVAIIDENLAHEYWPNQDAVGQRIRNGNNQPWKTIVGIVAHVRHYQVVGEETSNIGTEGSGKGVYYFPLYQENSPAVFLIARTNGDPVALAASIRAAVHDVDPGQPVSDLRTMDQRITLSMGPRRSAVTLLSVFAAMALLLAAVGLFGLIRYNVTQRTQEIGVRMAIGASRKDILRMVLGESLRLALLGVAGGLIAAFALTRVLSSLLYGVSATDPLTFAGTSLALTFVALLASWVPAWRATRVDPLVALRYE
ncbi:MAG TPA: ABC transporter permease [Candidatus Acidoferrum sp.]|nr:ABC transporter permease [Candidatus Acidoferrum sp.]